MAILYQRKTGSACFRRTDEDSKELLGGTNMYRKYYAGETVKPVSQQSTVYAVVNNFCLNSSKDPYKVFYNQRTD